jgi:AcrR family transcriptional regulator
LTDRLTRIVSSRDDEIMAATHRALCEHGYAGLTMQRIADRTDTSKAALHYHYDTKADLLEAFLDHVVEWFETEFDPETASPEERLRSVLEAIFDRAESDRGRYAVALLEIKAQAPFEAAYRDRLRTLDDSLRGTVAAAVRDGIESGAFADADPEEVARFVATATNGCHVREVALGEDPERTRALVEAYLESELGVDLGSGEA